MRFATRTVLRVTTGRLVTAPDEGGGHGIGDLYKILNHMTDDNLYTHQLPRANRECVPWVLRWFPELAKVDESLPRLDELLAESQSLQSVETWLAEVCEALQLPETYDVPRIPQDDHERKDPLAELIEMRGGTDGIVIVTPDD